MLKVENLKVRYGVIEAVHGISFNIQQGEIVTLIGANGAGKTSILRSISGLNKFSEGSVSFEDKNLQKVNPQKIVELGISQVPEGRHVFPGMTVKENLEMGAFLRKKNKELAADYKKVFEYFPILAERRNQDASTLSGGEQQMLAMGRALMSKPKLLLLDEPSMGLAPMFIEEIFKIITQINSEGTTILVIEQNANKALSIANRGYVLEAGFIVLEGSGAELLASEEVKKAYLGI